MLSPSAVATKPVDRSVRWHLLPLSLSHSWKVSTIVSLLTAYETDICCYPLISHNWCFFLVSPCRYRCRRVFQWKLQSTLLPTAVWLPWIDARVMHETIIQVEKAMLKKLVYFLWVHPHIHQCNHSVLMHFVLDWIILYRADHFVSKMLAVRLWTVENVPRWDNWIINELSRWRVRRGRERWQKKGADWNVMGSSVLMGQQHFRAFIFFLYLIRQFQVQVHATTQSKGWRAFSGFVIDSCTKRETCTQLGNLGLGKRGGQKRCNAIVPWCLMLLLFEHWMLLTNKKNF